MESIRLTPFPYSNLIPAKQNQWKLKLAVADVINTRDINIEAYNDIQLTCRSHGCVGNNIFFQFLLVMEHERRGL